MDVTSFGIDHTRLLRGIYVSRKDTVGDGVLTTFDVRMKEPNREMVLDTSVMHTIEHLMATFFRAHPFWGEKTIYIGPMGCRIYPFTVADYHQWNFFCNILRAQRAKAGKEEAMKVAQKKSLRQRRKCAAIIWIIIWASQKSNVRNS